MRCGTHIDSPSKQGSEDMVWLVMKRNKWSKTHHLAIHRAHNSCHGRSICPWLCMRHIDTNHHTGLVEHPAQRCRRVLIHLSGRWSSPWHGAEGVIRAANFSVNFEQQIGAVALLRLPANLLPLHTLRYHSIHIRDILQQIVRIVTKNT
jgi:hypothetical protein